MTHFDPATWETMAKVATVVGSFAGGYVASLGSSWRLKRQDRTLDWQNAVLEALARKGGTIPPPRPPATSSVEIDDPFPDEQTLPVINRKK